MQPDLEATSLNLKQETWDLPGVAILGPPTPINSFQNLNQNPHPQKPTQHNEALTTDHQMLCETLAANDRIPNCGLLCQGCRRGPLGWAQAFPPPRTSQSSCRRHAAWDRRGKAKVGGTGMCYRDSHALVVARKTMRTNTDSSRFQLQ